MATQSVPGTDPKLLAMGNSPIPYSDLPSNRHIRLIKLDAGTFDQPLSLALQCVSLDDKPKFEALSYTWGDASQSRRNILCDGLSVQIGRNLYDALRYWRSATEVHVIWADAICINQNSDSERSQQVKLMGEIYSTAAATRIWLGEETDDTKGAFSALQKFSDELSLQSIQISTLPVPEHYGMLEKVYGSRLSPELSYISKLFSRPWFGRKWIIQELILSTNPTLMLGEQMLPFDVLEGFVRYIEIYKLSLRLLGDVSDPTPMRHCRHIVMLLAVKNARKQVQLPLIETVIMFGNFSCKDPKDHVISLLGISSPLSSDHLNFLTDYSQPVSDIFAFFAKWSIMQFRCLDIFSLKTPLAMETSGLPSWAPDLAQYSSTKVPATPLYIPTYQYRAAGDTVVSVTEVDGRLLRIEGRIVDTVQEIASAKLLLLGDTKTLDPAMESQQWPQRSRAKMLEKLDVLESVGLRALEKEFEASELDGMRSDTNHNISGSTIPRTELSQGRIKFLRVLLGDYKDRFSEDELKRYHRCLQIFRCCQGMDPNSVASEEAQEELWKNAPEFDEFTQGLWFREFCVTKSNRLGWVPPSCEVGDVIAVLDGGKCPHILRQTGNGRYKLVGDCYIQGLMVGEALSLPGVSRETIILE